MIVEVLITPKKSVDDVKFYGPDRVRIEASGLISGLCKGVRAWKKTWRSHEENRGRRLPRVDVSARVLINGGRPV